MRGFIIFVSLWFCLTGLVSSQSNRSSGLFGARGLAITEEILAELALPDWYWGGAHIYKNVEQNYRLVNNKLLDSFFSTRPANGGLYDPQNILNDEQRKKIEKLIASHDMKSAMPLYVNMLAHGQKLSLTEAQLKLRLGKTFRDKNAFVVFYFYGYARGVKGYVLLDDVGFIEDWEVVELFLKSARDAGANVEDFLELESFIKDISKRSYWLEQRLIPPVLVEKQTDQESGQKKKPTDWDQWLLIFTDHSLSIVLAFFILAAGGWYYLWSHKWRKFVLPDGDVAVRLGADYGANVSDTIKFSDPKVSLAEQFDKLKNREL